MTIQAPFAYRSEMFVSKAKGQVQKKVNQSNIKGLEIHILINLINDPIRWHNLQSPQGT